MSGGRRWCASPASARFRGFTLIELLTVIVIVSILAAVVIPGYRDYVHTARRADARAVLLDMAARQARYMTMHGVYTDVPKNLGVPGNRFPMDISSGQLAGAQTGGSGAPAVWYRLSLTLVRNGQGFEATAQPVNAQRDDRCGVFVLDELGRQSNRTGLLASSQCW